MKPVSTSIMSGLVLQTIVDVLKNIFFCLCFTGKKIVTVILCHLITAAWLWGEAFDCELALRCSHSIYKILSTKWKLLFVFHTNYKLFMTPDPSWHLHIPLGTKFNNKICNILSAPKILVNISQVGQSKLEVLANIVNPIFLE